MNSNFQEITNSVQLNFILQKLYSNYNNKNINKIKFNTFVVPIDKLKNVKHADNQIIIVNFQSSYQSGNHWVMILNYSNKYVEYFDSFAVQPPEPILQFMRKYNKDMIMTTKQIQTFSESSCGWYCLKYLYFRINKNQPPYEAINNITYRNTIEYGKNLTNNI